MQLPIVNHLKSVVSALALTILLVPLSTEAAQLTSGKLKFQGESRAPDENRMFAQFKKYSLSDDENNFYAPFGTYGEFEITKVRGAFSPLAIGFDENYEIFSVEQFSDLLSAPFMRFPVETILWEVFIDPSSVVSETTPDGIITETTAKGFLVVEESMEESTPVLFEFTETVSGFIEGGERIEYEGVLTISAIPEPNATLGLLALSLGGIGLSILGKK
ncbi:MAG: hypothetical protein QNJ37_14470 [Crocosphaera sp.]|nr:hypothetical protein [Crocosphaera sp.]